MTIDESAKIAQIAFYAVVGTVTVFTFWRAKKGLLNSVNTEYHKKVIQRLEELSQTLLEEYDWDSPNHWSRKDPVQDVVKQINARYLEERKAITEYGHFPGIPTHPDYHRLKALVQRVKSDPFIPRSIRTRVVDLLENRSDVIIQIHLDHFRAYTEDLIKGKFTGDLNRNGGWLHNRILEDLRKRGCGIEQIEKEVHEIRLAIQAYFERFDPES